MKKNILTILFSVISILCLSQVQKFTFISNGSEFSLGDFTSVLSGDMVISPALASGETTIEKNKAYTILPDQEYQIAGQFEKLAVNNNNLTKLDVSELTILNGLVCSYNHLTSLDLTALTELIALDCSSNPLDSFNVSSSTNLVGLSCINNGLKSLDISALKDLKFLNCSRNKLSSLNLFGLAALERLACYGNSLNSLNLTALDNLTIVDCSENNFSVCGLDSLFLSLPTKEETPNLPIIFICKNQSTTPPFNQCKTFIASEKNWEVKDFGNFETLVNVEPFGCVETDIKELEFSSIDNKDIVYASDSYISIYVSKTGPVYIYDSLGRNVFNGILFESQEKIISLNPGLYIVKTVDATYKVVVG